MNRFLERFFEFTAAGGEQITGNQTFLNGVLRYIAEFMEPFWIALNAFLTLEKEKSREYPLMDTFRDYLELLQFNLETAEKGLFSSLQIMQDYHLQQSTKAFSAWLNTLFTGSEDMAEFTAKQAKLMAHVVHTYPKAIRDIEPEYGFHFDDGGYIKVSETDRFLLYQVLPLDQQKIKVRENGKPIIIIPPYVLGVNILAFLPKEGKSYVHCFANQGIPTYIRVIKDIHATPAVQVMTGEDDALDTRYFCEKVKKRHNRMVTLNGFCQGGFMALVDILSGELDGLVDALITCVAPMDGTRSKSLIGYLEHLPPRFRDLGYAVKTLPNGNQVVDGKVMSWVYKLKSMETEAPLFAFYRDLMMLDRLGDKKLKVSKTAAAINHWLIYDRTDLPVAITKMSFDSYTVPVSKDGTLPIELFGRKLNFKRLKYKKIKFLICYGENDQLVEKDTAIAPLDYIEADVTSYPKGHGAIATSWAAAMVDCVVHDGSGSRNLLCAEIPDTDSCTNSCSDGLASCRGPVRYQLDLDYIDDRRT